MYPYNSDENGGQEQIIVLEIRILYYIIFFSNVLSIK